VLEEEPPGVLEEEEEAPLTSSLSRSMKPPFDAREEERCGGG
jgi:hypothetical protein